MEKEKLIRGLFGNTYKSKCGCGEIRQHATVLKTVGEIRMGSNPFTRTIPTNEYIRY